MDPTEDPDPLTAPYAYAKENNYTRNIRIKSITPQRGGREKKVDE